MPQPQKDESSKNTKIKDVSDLTMIGELVECISEDLRRELDQENDPFVSYAHELRLRLYSDVKVFQERFVQGYKVLLETLSSPPKS